jgi:hypothetical protein
MKRLREISKGKMKKKETRKINDGQGKRKTGLKSS